MTAVTVVVVLLALTYALLLWTSSISDRCRATNGRQRCDCPSGHTGEHVSWVDRGHNGPKYFINWEDGEEE